MRKFLIIAAIATCFSCAKEETQINPGAISFEPYASMGMDQDPIPFHPSDAISFGCNFDFNYDGPINISYQINDEKSVGLYFGTPGFRLDTLATWMDTFLKSFKVDVKHGDLVKVNVFKNSDVEAANSGSITFRADSSMQKTLSWEIEFPLGDNGSWNYYLDWDNFVVYDDYTKIQNSMDINMVVDTRYAHKFRLWNPSTPDSVWESHGANSAHPLKREYMFDFPEEECTNGRFLSLDNNTSFYQFFKVVRPEHVYTYLPLKKADFIESYSDGSSYGFGFFPLFGSPWNVNLYQEVGSENEGPTVLMFRQSENAGVETIKLIVRKPV
jgi:hypothetical protein